VQHCTAEWNGRLTRDAQLCKYTHGQVSPLLLCQRDRSLVLSHLFLPRHAREAVLLEGLAANVCHAAAGRASAALWVPSLPAESTSSGEQRLSAARLQSGCVGSTQSMHSGHAERPVFSNRFSTTQYYRPTCVADLPQHRHRLGRSWGGAVGGHGCGGRPPAVPRCTQQLGQQQRCGSTLRIVSLCLGAAATGGGQRAYLGPSGQCNSGQAYMPRRLRCRRFPRTWRSWPFVVACTVVDWLDGSWLTGSSLFSSRRVFRHRETVWRQARPSSCVTRFTSFFF
jgi:hypothetical protein